MNDNTDDTFDTLIDGAVNAIKAETPNAAEINAAADRVRGTLFENNKVESEKLENTELNDSELNSATDESSLHTDHQLNSTDNYIAAIPDYLAGRLSSAQKVLFEEESRQSIPLRRALNAAKQQQAAQISHPRRKRRNTMQWFASAAAIAIVAVSWVFVLPQLPALDQSQLAQVESVNGNLFKVIDGRLAPLTSGAWIDGRQDVRTATNSTAMVRLDDGSLIEIDQRSEFSFTRRGRGNGNRIDVDRGKLIVAASPQGSGTLDVATNEFVVSVVGTIFEVGHGTNGSRVSVIEGEVHVHQEGDSTSLTPGERFASRMGKSLLGVEDFAWSVNADEYIALLRNAEALQQELEAVLDTEPRYSTRLLNLVPEQTVVYGAVPNAPQKIAEFYEVISNYIEQSDRLSRAVARTDIDTELEQLEDVMIWLAEVGDTLGEETVAALVLQQTQDNNSAHPLILSEVNAEAFRETLEAQLVEMQAVLNEAAEEDGVESTHNDPLPISIINDPSEAQANQLSIWLHEDLLIASTNQQVLFAVQEAIITGSNGFSTTGFYTELVNYYDRGVEFLGGVNIETIIALEQSQSGAESITEMEALGIDNAQYLIVHHLGQRDRVNFTADLLFDGERHGVMSWLAEPNPMGSLEFFSGNSALVNAGIIKQPSIIFEEFKVMSERVSGVPWETLDDEGPERQLRDNFIQALGGELAFGLDGPAVPTPAWKIVVEVYDEILFQDTLEQAIDLINDETDSAANISITPADVGIYAGYQLQFTATFDGLDDIVDIETGSAAEAGAESTDNANDDAEGSTISTDISINYAYVDGYILFAPNIPLLERSINQYQSGTNLLAEAVFQSLLPANYLDVSALSYNRVNRVLGDLVNSLPAGVVLTDAQRSEIRDIYMDRDIYGGSMVVAIGEPDSIRVLQSGGSLLPINMMSIFSMETVAGLLIGEPALVRLPEGDGDDDIEFEVDIDF